MSRPIDSTHPAEPVTARHIEEAAKQKAVATSEKREFADVDVDADAKHLDNVGSNPNAALENPLQVRLRCSGEWPFSRKLPATFSAFPIHLPPPFPLHGPPSSSSDADYLMLPS